MTASLFLASLNPHIVQVIFLRFLWRLQALKTLSSLSLRIILTSPCKTSNEDYFVLGCDFLPAHLCPFEFVHSDAVLSAMYAWGRSLAKRPAGDVRSVYIFVCLIVKV